MLLHSRLNPQVLDHLTLDLYSSEFGLVAVSLSTGSKFKTKRWLSKFFDGVSVYEAEVDHDLYMAQLLEYFNGSRRIFEFPVDLRGTDFQKKVWGAISSIPFGQTASYQQVAEMIGNPKASRAVGLANQRNPVPIVIPCHRVVGKNGSLTGYEGGLPLKRKLLSFEGSLRTTPAVQMQLF